MLKHSHKINLKIYMGLIDLIEAWSGPYRNFSCRSRTLDGFERCYNYTSGNTHYYDNGYDCKSYDYSNTDKSPKTITKTYKTEFILSYKKRMKRMKIWETIASFVSIIGTAGVAPSVLYMIIFFNTESFIVLGAVLSVTIISLIVWKGLTNKVFMESDPILDAWLG